MSREKRITEEIYSGARCERDPLGLRSGPILSGYNGCGSYFETPLDEALRNSLLRFSRKAWRLSSPEPEGTSFPEPTVRFERHSSGHSELCLSGALRYRTAGASVAKDRGRCRRANSRTVMRDDRSSPRKCPYNLQL
jgi:hypothetical protein